MARISYSNRNAATAAISAADEDRRRREALTLSQENAGRAAQAQEFEQRRTQRADKEGRGLAQVVRGRLESLSAQSPDDTRAAFHADLAAVGPGGATMAFDLSTAASGRTREHEEEMERLAIESAATADDITYRYATEQLGHSVVPPEVEADVNARAAYGRAALLAESLYRGSPQQAHAFAFRFLSNGGDLTEAAQAVGPPVDKPTWSIQTVIANGERVMAFVDSVSGQVRMAQAPGGGGLVEMPAPAGASPYRKDQSPRQVWLDTYQNMLAAATGSMWFDATKPEDVAAAERAARDGADRAMAMAIQLQQQLGGPGGQGLEAITPQAPPPAPGTGAPNARQEDFDPLGWSIGHEPALQPRGQQLVPGSPHIPPQAAPQIPMPQDFAPPDTAVARPQSQAEYDALPPGALYWHPNGDQRRKPF